MDNIPDRPRVSGIMAARNSAAYLSATMESALRQTHANFELLVVDDASTDGTAEMVESYARRDARVRLLRQPEWTGQCAARNLALREARGEWIAVLDSDDHWRPTHLERQLAAIEENPGACLATSDYQKMDGEGRTLEVVPCPWPEWWLRWRLLFGNAIGGHSQVLFLRETALACGGYRDDRKTAEDYQLWIDLAERGGIAYTPEVLMDYRVHEKAESTVNGKLQAGLALEISDQALRTLLGEAVTTERLAQLRAFWSEESFAVKEGSLQQVARDLRQLEDAFWRRHPELATLENRIELVDRIRRRWGRGKSLATRYFGLMRRFERNRMRLALR